MLNQNITLRSVKEISEKIRTGEITPTELVEIYLKSIQKLDPLLNAFITVVGYQAYKDAQAADKEIKQGNYLGPLHGIPFSVKDIFNVKGVRCTAGSKALSRHVAENDATCVKKLKKAGAILIGTNNLNECAIGLTGINNHFGRSLNPWNACKLSGGSSGGSAVAVASGMVPVALGTDTGGSILVPSSFCGVVGLKPTYGRVSKYGVMPVAPSMDHVGFMTRTAWDAAAVLECIAGWDPLDKDSINNTVNSYTRIIEDFRVEKISLGIPKGYFTDCLDCEVEDQFYTFIDAMGSFGFQVQDVNLTKTDKYYDPCVKVARAEAAEIHLEEIENMQQEYCEDSRSTLIEGRQLSAVSYIRYIKTINETKNELLEVLKKEVDVIIMPTTILSAPNFDQYKVNVCGKMLDLCESLNRNNVIFNGTGLPTANILGGFTKDHMPIGIQIVGSLFDEGKVLAIANSYEHLNDNLNKMVPPSVCQ